MTFPGAPHTFFSGGRNTTVDFCFIDCWAPHLSCVYTSQVRTRDHPSRDHGYWSDVGPAFTCIRARKYITTCNHCATLFTRPFCSHVCFVKMPTLWEDSEVLFLLEIRGDQEIQKQYYEGSTYTRSILGTSKSFYVSNIC